MLLAVAGMNDSAVREVTELIGSGYWETFTPAERMAFSLAYKLSREPDSITMEDRRDLLKTYGAPAALDLIWNIAWSNYMTRFADAFQLPLENENVFGPEKE